MACGAQYPAPEPGTGGTRFVQGGPTERRHAGTKPAARPESVHHSVPEVSRQTAENRGLVGEPLISTGGWFSGRVVRRQLDAGHAARPGDIARDRKQREEPPDDERGGPG